MQRQIQLPLKESDILSLKAGDAVFLNGPLYSGRDAAHKRLLDAIENDQPLPFNISGETIYYAGPCPTPPGRIVGSMGPTTSGRMDPYTVKLIELGLKGMVGKGQRSVEVMEAMKKFQAVYFAALGGAGALIARSIQSVEIIAYPDLGPEAVRRLIVKELPVIVAVDAEGNDLYREGRARYARI